MIGQPSHLILSVLAGDARERSLGLEWGRHRGPFSVGKQGDWAISAPGVADVHLYLAFRGSRLCVAPASTETRVSSRGVRLPETWSELALPAELHFGQARLRASSSVSSTESLASTRHVDVKRLAPLLDASRPRGSRPPGAALETARAEPREALLETVCDGGALRRHAERLLAEAGAAARALPSELASPALRAPDPSAFAAEPQLAAAPEPAACLRPLARRLRSAGARCWSQAAQRWHELRALSVPPRLAASVSSARARRGAIAALSALLLAVLAGRLLAPAGSAAPLGTSAAAVDVTAEPGAAARRAPEEHAALGAVTARPRASSHAQTAPDEPDTAPQHDREPGVELAPPSPELQREAFRAAQGGDSAAAAALYRQLAQGTDGRVFQLAARYAAQGRVRKP